jgi:hypothetical protein
VTTIPPVICEEVVATTNIGSWEIHGNPKVNKKTIQVPDVLFLDNTRDQKKSAEAS